MKAIAFAPGHITCFFKIVCDKDKKIIGSIGAGLCISLGSYAVAETGVTHLTLLGNVGEGEVTRTALDHLKVTGMHITVVNNLPFSQGFGVSASSSLAATFAAAKIAGYNDNDALKATHDAEMLHRTGLGDATTSFLGGLELRKTPGLNAVIEKIVVRKRLLLAIVGNKIPTYDILNDKRKVKAINKSYQRAQDDYDGTPDLEHLLDVSYRFSLESSLLNPLMQHILYDANTIGHATMCMLGNSIVATHTPEMKQFLSKYEHYECAIDNEGARTLATFLP